MEPKACSSGGTPLSLKACSRPRFKRAQLTSYMVLACEERESGLSSREGVAMRHSFVSWSQASCAVGG